MQRSKQTNLIRYLFYLLLGVLAFLFWKALPGTLFRDPTSTVLLDRNGVLLGAKIADDGQWRFPENTVVPEKFRQAVIHSEDRYFLFHPGVNPYAILRALYLNLTHGRIVSGGSTITMQVIRLAGKNRDRTYPEKLREIFLAFRLEFTCSKAKILGLYASHAPFGGNIVGLDAASWRYFGVDPSQLSWAEAATLAVLPNSPGLIYPGRTPAALRAKRDRLLDLLRERGVIDGITCRLAKSEPLPGKPLPLPRLAPHLLTRAVAEKHRGERLNTTLDAGLQQQVNGILEYHADRFRANEIHNAAALVLETGTGNVLAYAGNLPAIEGPGRGNDVDIIASPRSTGSILKPFLYAAMLNDGLLLPGTLVPDIPMQIGGFIPENYNLTYDGAVPAKMALSRSLNIPAVKMLQDYGYEQFCALLHRLGMTTLTQPAGHYGLSIILGGAEATLWDLAGIYASMARTLEHYIQHGAMYDRSDFHPPRYLAGGQPGRTGYNDRSSLLDAGSVWLAFEAMAEVSRPDVDQQWQQFASSHQIAWKTGTSFGNRDAWSVGVTPEYVVAVWAGNASGEGRPGLTGINIAAPVLFDIYKIIPPGTWFRRPDDALVRIPVCRYSGYRATALCDSVDSAWVQKAGLKTAPCPFHRIVHLDTTGKWQVTADCERPENIRNVSWFVLPPVQEWYFRNRNPFYKVLPPFRPGCGPEVSAGNMGLIYPKNNSRIYIPTELDGKAGSAVFRAAHRNVLAIVYWHLDDRFLGETKRLHQMAISAPPGWHRLTLVDNEGESLTARFEVIGK